MSPCDRLRPVRPLGDLATLSDERLDLADIDRPTGYGSSEGGAGAGADAESAASAAFFSGEGLESG